MNYFNLFTNAFKNKSRYPSFNSQDGISAAGSFLGNILAKSGGKAVANPEYSPNLDPDFQGPQQPALIEQKQGFFDKMLRGRDTSYEDLTNNLAMQQALYNSMTPALVQRETTTQRALNKLAGEREKARLDLDFENKRKEEDYKRAGLAQDAQYAVANRQIPASSLPTGAPYIDDSTRGRALENMFGSNLQRGFLEGVPNAEAAATQSKYAKSVLDAKNPFAYDIGTSAARREIQENKTGEATAKLTEEGAQGSLYDARENARSRGEITGKELETQKSFLSSPDGIRALLLSLEDKYAPVIHAGDSAFRRLGGQIFQGSSVERETKPGAVVARDKQGREIKGEPTVEYKTRPPRVSSLPNFISNPNPQETNSFPGMSLKPRTEDEELMDLIRRLQATGGY